MLRSVFVVVAVYAALFAAGHAFADSRVAVSGSIGTLGGEAQVHLQLSRFLSLRAGYNYLEGEIDETYEDVDYTVDATFSGPMAAVDLHPFMNGFVLSAGFHFAEKQADLFAVPNQPVEIGSTTYQPADVGSIAGEADLGGASPYLGLGWNGAFSNGRLGFTAMVGALLLDEPTVDLSASGPIASDPTFIADLQAEEDAIQDDLDEYPFYPVVSLGLVVRF